MSLTPQELANQIDDLISRYSATTDENEQEVIAEQIEKLENSLISNPIIKAVLPDKYEEDVKLTKELSESKESPIDLHKQFGKKLGNESKKLFAKEIKDNFDGEIDILIKIVENFNSTNATEKENIGKTFAGVFPNLIDLINNHPIVSKHKAEIMDLKPFTKKIHITEYLYAIDGSRKFKKIKLTGDKSFNTETLREFISNPIDPTKDYVYFELINYGINDYNKANSVADIPDLNTLRNVSYNVISYTDFFEYVVKAIIKEIKDNEDNWIDEYVKSEMVGGKLTLAQKLAMQQTIARLQRLKPILIAMPQATPMPPPTKPMSATGLPGLQNEEKMRKIAQAILLYHISMITDKDTEMIDKLKNFGCDDQFITSIIMAPNKKIVAELVKSYKPSQYDMLYQLIVNSRRESEKIKFQRNWSVPFNSMSYGVNAYNNMFWKNSPSQVNFLL